MKSTSMGVDKSAAEAAFEKRERRRLRIRVGRDARPAKIIAENARVPQVAHVLVVEVGRGAPRFLRRRGAVEIKRVGPVIENHRRRLETPAEIRSRYERLAFAAQVPHAVDQVALGTALVR